MNQPLKNYHSAVWDEPVVMELGAPGRRGILFPDTEQRISDIVGEAQDLLAENIRRQSPIGLPELSEPEVLRHYLHLSQQTLGMMGVSLFGTCTMKYNPRLNEVMIMIPHLSEVHPHQNPETLQGVLEVIYRFDLILRELSGMDRFVFQAGGGADASYLHATITRATSACGWPAPASRPASPTAPPMISATTSPATPCTSTS